MTGNTFSGAGSAGAAGAASPETAPATSCVAVLLEDLAAALRFAHHPLMGP